MDVDIGRSSLTRKIINTRLVGGKDMSVQPKAILIEIGTRQGDFVRLRVEIIDTDDRSIDQRDRSVDAELYQPLSRQFHYSPLYHLPRHMVFN